MIAVSSLRRRAVHRVAIPCIAVAAAAVAASALAQARPSPASFADLAEKVAPAVVNISAERKAAASGRRDRASRFPSPEDTPFGEFFERFRRETPGFRLPEREPPSGGGRALGSGFLVDPAGYVVTNHHVVAGADDVRVTLHDGESHRARLVGADPRTDLALLKIDAGRALPAVSFGDSSRIRAGDWVMAVGNPFGLGGTITAGIVSARGRDLPGGALVDFLQIDAPINRGNSGGPAFDADGKVIGVNTAIFSPTGGSVGIGFAIPSNVAGPVIAELRDKGRIERGWLGVSIQQVTPTIAEGLGLAKPKGALVASVVPGGPAAEAGLRAGDVIVTWDGEEIERFKDLPRRVGAAATGEEIDVEILRGGETRRVRVTTGRTPERLVRADADAPRDIGPGRLAGTGITVVELTQALRARHGIAKEVSGVMVAGVTSGSDAFAQGLRRGDVIASVSLRPVDGVGEAAATMEELRRQGRKAATLFVWRDGAGRFVAVRLADA